MLAQCRSWFKSLLSWASRQARGKPLKPFGHEAVRVWPQKARQSLL